MPENFENQNQEDPNIIKGNERLEALRQLIEAGEATDDEKKEFEQTKDLYDRERLGDKPWRQNPEWYQATEELRKQNEAKRETK